jgi:predicted dehydrogenase
MLRIALIGAGGIGKIWAEGVKKTKSVDLAAVVDVREDSAAAIAKDFNT